MVEKRGRKPTLPIVSKEVPMAEDLLAADKNAVDAFSALKKAYNGERDLLNQLVGRVQMGSAMHSFAQVINVQTLSQIKESKAYRAFDGTAGVDHHGRTIPNLGTWDGFCRYVGISPDKADDDIKNLANFGEEALGFFAAIGAGYRELRQYRKLPEDSKQALIEVAKTGDKDGFLDLAEEIIARHHKEKESLQAQVTEARGEKEAVEKLLDAKNKRIDQLDREVVRIQNLPPNEAAKELVNAAAGAMYGVQGSINGHFRAALQELNDSEIIEGKKQVMAGMVNQLILDLMVLRDQFNLPDTVGDGRPQWMHWSEDQDRLETAALGESSSKPN